MGCTSNVTLKSYPKSGIFKVDYEKDKKLKNSLGNINFEELFMESLTPEFLNLFKLNSKLFYSNTFYKEYVMNMD